MFFLAYDDEDFSFAQNQYDGHARLTDAINEGAREVYSEGAESFKVYHDDGSLALTFNHDECIDYFERELAAEDELERAIDEDNWLHEQLKRG